MNSSYSIQIFAVDEESKSETHRTPSQQLATCCLADFLVMLPVITKKCCCCGVRPPLYLLILGCPESSERF
jgi:hypothetical protein